MSAENEITANQARSIAWSAWQTRYGDRYNAIIQKIIVSANDGLISIEESIPLASLKYMTTRLEAKFFKINPRLDLDAPESGEVSEDIVITISWE